MKYINNMTIVYMFWLIAIIIQLFEISSLPYTSLTMTLSSYEIEASANYKFKIDLQGDMIDSFVIPSGTQIIVTFPSAYPSTSITNNNCSILSWPAAATGISCTYGYNILTISNGFTNAISMLPTDLISFEFVVYSITNPSYSQTIPSSSIVGKLRSNFVQILSIDVATSITIESGSLVVRLSCSPNTTSSTSILTITVEPTHSIPDSGCLKITFDKNYTNAVSPTTLNTQLPNCLPLSNVSSNIYCSTEAANVVFVTNLFTAKSSVPFSFTLSPFNNPPTTQPYGSIIFETFNDRTKLLKIDSSSNNKISGIVANSIQNPQIFFSNTLMGSLTQTSISMTITNGIMASDTVFVTTPSEINCANVASVVMGSISGTSLSVINSTTFSFRNIALNNPLPINLIINSLTLPSYAASINSPFLIYVMRSNYEVCKMNQSFSISLTPSQISGSLSATNYQAGVSSSYTFTLALQQSITSTSIIELYFNPIQFTLSQPITCLSSASTTCQIHLSVVNNTLRLSSATISSTKSLSLTISGLKNPSSVGNFTPIFITTYVQVNSQYFLLGANNNFSFFSVGPRSMSFDNLKLSSTSSRVYALATYTFTIKNNNFLPLNSKIRIIFPTQINIQSISCPQVCVPIISNSSSSVQFQQLGPIAAGSQTLLVVNNVINPISTKPTSSFRLQIYDNHNIMLQFLQAGTTFQATIPSSLSVGYSAQKLQNGFTGWMNITLTPLYSISQAVAIVIILPKEFKCSSCATSILNSLENQLVFSNRQMIDGKYDLYLSGFSLYYSFQPKTLAIGILSNNLAFNFANGSITITNMIASTLTFSYQFTSYQLLEISSLQISNFTSQANFQYANFIQIVFGADFDISGVSCLNTDLICTVTSSKIRVALLNQGNLTSISIINIINPGTSPSTLISFSSYSSSGHLIDQNFDMTWVIGCNLPCKGCATSNSSQCLNCYSNEVLVQSRVLFLASTSSCVSDCGDQFYRNYTTNICLSCSSACLNCYNQSYCTSCPQSKYLLSSTFTCYSNCPTGYFQKSSNCLACTPILNCYTCSNELTCTSCFGFFYYQSQCLSQCPILITITNSINYTCDPCPANCSTCELKNGSSFCLSCTSGLMDNGACVQNCITYGTVPSNSVCGPCDSNCLTCQGITTYCLTCSNTTEYRYFLSNKCYKICPDRYYNNDHTFTCVSCTYPCQTCYNFSSTGCKTCLSSFSLFDTICSSSCPSTYFSAGKTCQLCQAPCLTCSSARLCFTCRSNFTFFASNYSCLDSCPPGYVTVNQTCTICSSNCQTCLTVTFCSSCHNGSYLINGNCYNPCPSTFFGNSLTMKCESCHFSCLSCTSSTFCSVCNTGYYMQANNTCISLCLSNQIPINGNCQSCNSKCSICQISVNNCTACNSGYIYAPTLNMCYLQCPSPLIYSILNNTCISSCSGTFYTAINSTTNRSNCLSCPSLCTSCISNTQCGGCISGSYSYDSQCFLACPPTAPYSFSFTCQTCNVLDCLICTATLCQSCKSGKFLIQGKSCITSCSNLQIYNSVNKTCDTIYQGGSNSSNSNQTIITNPTSISTAINLQFIPFPFFIVFVIASLIILMLHFKAKLAAVPTLYGIVGPFLSFSILTTIIISLIKDQSSSITLQLTIYLLCTTMAFIFCLGIIAVRFRYQVAQCEKPIVNTIAIVHYSSMSLLTANIGQYNSYFILQHKKYWKRYKTISKLGMLLAIPIFISGGVLSFSITDKSNFLFYAGIEVCLLGFLNLMLTLAWLWIPIQPPPENQSVTSSSSEQSTEQLSDNHQSDSIAPSSNQNNSLSKMDSMGKLRSSEQKQDSFVRDSVKDHSDQQKQLSQIAQQPFQQGDIQRRLRNSFVKSEIQKPEAVDKSTQKAKSTYEFNQIGRVVKVNKSDIQKAIQKGLFRKDETEILKAIKQQEEYSRIADAQKLNEYMNKQQKQINIFEQYHQEQEQKSPKMQKNRDEEKIEPLQIQQDSPQKQIILNQPKAQTIVSSSIKKQSLIQQPKSNPQVHKEKEVDASIANSFKRQTDIFSQIMNEKTIIFPQNKQAVAVIDNGYDFKADSDINFFNKRNPQAFIPSRTSTQRGSRMDQIIFQQNPKLSENSNLEKELNVFGDIQDIEDMDNVTSKEELQFNNIIFQEEDQQKRTYYEGGSSLAEDHENKNVFDVSSHSSLGTIQHKKVTPIKVESQSKKQQRLSSPSFESKERRTLLMQDFDEEQKSKQINIFGNQQSIIKPKFSKQLSRVLAPQQIIHADFQEIISIEDGDSLQFIQQGHQFIESGRKLNNRINQDIHDHDIDSHDFRPSSMLRLASIHYQPVKEQNNAPKDPSKQAPRFGGRFGRKQ